MANRSYLYASNSLPTSYKDEYQSIGLSEYKYGVPAAFMILAAGKAAECNSSIWEGAKAIIGDYQTGTEYLKGFLDYLKTILTNNKETFSASYDTTFKYLSDPEVVRKYILLETDEIWQMDSGESKELHHQLLEDIKILEKLLEARDYQRVLNFLRLEGQLQNWSEMELGIDDWSKYLYFSFPFVN